MGREGKGNYVRLQWQRAASPPDTHHQSAWRNMLFNPIMIHSYHSHTRTLAHTHTHTHPRSAPRASSSVQAGSLPPTDTTSRSKANGSTRRFGTEDTNTPCSIAPLTSIPAIRPRHRLPSLLVAGLGAVACARRPWNS